MNNQEIEIVYIDSTAHAQIIKNLPKIFKIKNYLFSDEYLSFSFKSIKSSKTNNFKVLKKNSLIKFLQLLFIILAIKFKKKKIIFFHECCNLQFDYIINFINPQGYFCPFDINYKMLMKKIDNILHFKKLSLIKRIYYFIIYLINKKKIKFFYREGNPLLSIYSFYSRYPKNIKKLNYSLFIKNNLNKKKNRKILLLLQRFTHKKFFKYFFIKFKKDMSKLEKLFKSKKIKIYYKDHPNKKNRLNYKNKNFKKLNFNIPCEFQKDDYCLVIGFASNPLCNFYLNRSVSLIEIYKNYIHKISYDNYPLYFKRWHHVNSKVYTPKNIKQLSNYITKKISNIK